jgi:hypothetical protein
LQEAAETIRPLTHLPASLIVQPSGPVPGRFLEGDTRPFVKCDDRGGKRVLHIAPDLRIGGNGLAAGSSRQLHRDRPFRQQDRQGGNVFGRPARELAMILVRGQAGDRGACHAR